MASPASASSSSGAVPIRDGSSANSWLWSEWFWLPNKVHWSDLSGNETVNYPQVHELAYTVYLGVALLAFRLALECTLFVALGHYGGWTGNDRSLGEKMAAHAQFGFAGKSKFKRVSETAWRFFFYLFVWLYGLYVVRSQPQYLDVLDCYRDYPFHPIDASVWWYYQLETGFYFSLLFSSVMFDIRRADFFEMTLHHCVTIGLLWISWTINMVRVGTLVLFIHDVADIFIELGKLARYARWQMTLNLIFCVFMVIWVGTRLVYYPTVIINSILFEAPEIIQRDYRWERLLEPPIVPRVLVVMLCCLLVLHIFWTWILIRVAIESVRSGEMDDIREDSGDEEEVDALKEGQKHLGQQNGSLVANGKKVD